MTKNLKRTEIYLDGPELLPNHPYYAAYIPADPGDVWPFGVKPYLTKWELLKFINDHKDFFFRSGDNFYYAEPDVDVSPLIIPTIFHEVNGIGLELFDLSEIGWCFAEAEEIGE